jgi:LCP family protein required for cell wall assembly
MSDGDRDPPAATPGPRHGHVDGSQEWLTRKPRPSPGAAPWERSRCFRPEPTPATNGQDPDPSGGSHTDGVSVADLIAKVSGVTPAAGDSRPRRSRRRPVAEDHLDAPDWDDAVTAQLPKLRAADVPDLTAAAQRRKAQALLLGKPENATRVISAVPEKRDKPKHKPHHPLVVAGRIAIALVSLVALVATGGAWQWSASKNHRLNYIAALDPNSRDIVDPGAQYGDENFLIVGVDSRFGANADMGAGNSEDAGGARSDTVMLVNIPASRKRVVAVSFPRDLAITPMLCDAWDSQTGKYGPVYDEQTGTYGPKQLYTETKLNSAYSYGGPKCLVKVLQKLSGLSINRFMAIDFSGFAKMVDTLGGVRVCSTTPLKDYELGTVLPQAGWQTIDGRTALNYVRARQVTTETNGDYGRIKRQQLFLSSLLRSLISNEVFFSLQKLNDVVNTFIDDSSVDNVGTKDLVDLGQSIQGMSAGHVTFLTVPTGETDADGNEPLRTQDNRALFDAIINDDPLPGENDQNETTTPTTHANTPLASSSPSSAATSHENGELVDAVTTAPQGITVHVSNSTGQDGLGATAAGELEQHGFKVTVPDDYPTTLASTTVLFSPGNEQAAATVASVFPKPSIQRVTGMADVVQVVLGSDFNSVSQPLPTGSSVTVRLTQNASVTPTKLPEDLSVTNAADASCE